MVTSAQSCACTLKAPASPIPAGQLDAESPLWNPQRARAAARTAHAATAQGRSRTDSVAHRSRSSSGRRAAQSRHYLEVGPVSRVSIGHVRASWPAPRPTAEELVNREVSSITRLVGSHASFGPAGGSRPLAEPASGRAPGRDCTNSATPCRYRCCSPSPILPAPPSLCVCRAGCDLAGDAAEDCARVLALSGAPR